MATTRHEILSGKDPHSTSVHRPAEVAVLKINGPGEFGSRRLVKGLWGPALLAGATV